MTGYVMHEDERLNLLVPKKSYADGILPRALVLELTNAEPCIPGLVVGMPVDLAKEMVEFALEAANNETKAAPMGKVLSRRVDGAYSNLVFQ
ncbi:hypothetical protein [Methylotenera sp.]|uniref:hypothetical protein n=1 Tax=Methylotenera sp. TaxID=2051956 RepID=UPI002ED9E615